MVVEIKGIWYTLEENKPNSNEEILIATTDGTVTFATFYEEDEGGVSMGLVIKEVQMPYHVHNISKEEEPKCCLCDSGVEVEKHTVMPVFLEGEMSYIMLCEKDHKKFLRRIKYRLFFEIVSKVKNLIKKVWRK